MNYLDELSIVIPTYERKKYCLRAIEYWSKFSASIYILDGSKKPLDKTIQENLSNNINYIHSPKSLYSRMASSTEMISTKYVAFLSDDEFFTIDGINESIKELELDRDLVTCSGNVMGFDIKKNKVYGFEIYKGLRNYSVMQNNIYKRLNYHMNLKYFPSTLYGISRTSFWKEAVNLTFKKEFTCYAIWEIQMESFMHLFGKSKVIDQLFWLRSFESEPIRGTSPSMTSKNFFYMWWEKEEFNEERKEFIKGFLQLNVTFKMNLHNIYEEIVKIFSNFAQQDKELRKKYELQEKKYNFLIKKVITKFFLSFPNLKIFLKKILKKDYSKEPVEINKYIKNLKEKNIGVNHQNINDIQILIKKYN